MVFEQADRDLYSATSAVSQDLGVCGLIQILILMRDNDRFDFGLGSVLKAALNICINEHINPKRN